MKNRRVYLLIALVVFVAIAAFTLFAANTSSGQATRQKSSSNTAPTTRVTSRTTATANAAFAAAATQNATLRNDLTWTFGGKQQHGWYLYDLLINQTLDTEHDPGTSDFAAAMAKWQKRAGLGTNGILDENALMRMISQWKSDRLKTRDV